MVDFDFDITTLATLGGFVGIILTFIFNLLIQKREAKRDKQLEDKERKLEQEKFVENVEHSISKNIQSLKEHVADKLENIKATSANLEQRFNDWKVVNRDDVLDIKQKLSKLYEDLQKLDDEGSEASTEKIEEIRNQIEGLEKRIIDIEWKINHTTPSDLLK